jgi:hypothetical protein
MIVLETTSLLGIGYASTSTILQRYIDSCVFFIVRSGSYHLKIWNWLVAVTYSDLKTVPYI